MSDEPATRSEPTTRLDDLSIVVLSFNRCDELMQNLRVLCELHLSAGAELIVVDNLSTDGTRERLRALAESIPGIRLVCMNENMGVAGGRNAGWAAATRDLILNLDDDTRIEPAQIRALCGAAADMPWAGIFTPKVVQAITGECQNGYGDDVAEPANFHGACHLVRAEVWRATGQIDPECTFGGEELDYSIRARCRGYPTVFLKNIVVKHNSLPRPGEVGRERRRRWVHNFSRIFFKHFPVGHAAVLTSRYLAAQVASAAAAADFVVIPSLLARSLSGMVSGRRRYVRLPLAVLNFYSNRGLQPDFGNRPLVQKFLHRWAKSG